MAVRDHTGIPITKFNGYWFRDNKDDTPPDHFQDCNNIDYDDQQFQTRPGIDISLDILFPLGNIRRIYNYPTQTANTLIVLTYDYDTNQGSIHHVVDQDTVFGPLLTIQYMLDFAFAPVAGRAYISPFASFQNGDLILQKGLENEVVYVYAGDGTAARPAAGSGIPGSMTIAIGPPGHTDPGLHIFGIVSQTSSGYNSPPTLLQSFTTIANNSVSFGSIPTSGDPHVVKRLLVATKVIPTFNGDLQGYEFFFVPDAVINNNTDTFLNSISFYDDDLLADASALLDNYTAIPAGAVMGVYHNRLCVAATFTDISLILVSLPGEPEAINQINGLIVFPLDGSPITNLQELRDVLYVFKRSKCTAWADNGDVPSSWPDTLIDAALGTCVHGVATVLDSGGTSVDFLLICTYQGISQFNGRFVSPELSWKIEQFWKNLNRNDFGFIQFINAPIQKELYLVLPTKQMLMGNYANGLDWKNIRWSPWSFRMGINTVAIQNIDSIILGADLN